MQKVAIFGNAGGGKSTLSKRLSLITGLPLHPLDTLKYQADGTEVSPDNFQQTHQMILQTERWIIDGFGSMETLWLRLTEADTLIFVDLPLYRHFWWVTKRLITGYFKPPEGWPEGSPLLKSSINSYRVLWLCHTRLTPKYREFIERSQTSKQVYHLRSPQQISQFLKTIEDETLQTVR